MQEITTVAELRKTVRAWRQAKDLIAFVPTMGALHSGHLSLVSEAQVRANRVIVSIFVNPTQFGPSEDFSRYPRPREQDLALLRSVKADAVWMPSVEEMYPQGFATNIHISGVTEGLCGATRRGHFDGVATVVSKLLLQIAPDLALFGEKDYQQLCVVRRLVADLNIPVEIEGIPTIREPDGLALSSRNRYLSPEEREIAPKLHAVLKQTATALKMTDDVDSVLEEAKAALAAAGFSSVDYLELRAKDTLAPLTHYQPSARLLAAAWLGKTRLIDNIPV